MDGRIAQLPRRIVNLSNDQPDAASVSEPVFASASQQTRRSRESAELKDPQRFLNISRYLLMAAFFPIPAIPPGLIVAG